MASNKIFKVHVPDLLNSTRLMSEGIVWGEPLRDDFEQAIRRLRSQGVIETCKRSVELKDTPPFEQPDYFITLGPNAPIGCDESKLKDLIIKTIEDLHKDFPFLESQKVVGMGNQYRTSILCEYMGSDKVLPEGKVVLARRINEILGTELSPETLGEAEEKITQALESKGLSYFAFYEKLNESVARAVFANENNLHTIQHFPLAEYSTARVRKTDLNKPWEALRSMTVDLAPKGVTMESLTSQ